MAISRLTSVGLFVASLGWIALFAGTWISALDPFRTPLPLPPVSVVATDIIVSGFALALLGSLHSGFGALNTFFTAALERSSRRQTEAAPAPQPPPQPQPAPKPTPVREPIRPAAYASEEPVEHGEISGRAYTLFGDGSVEVETLLGLRRFLSFEEARRFVG